MKDDTNKNSLQNPKKQPPWRPRKSLLYYYFIVLMIVFLFNMFVMPVMEEKQIVLSTYSDFLEKLDKGEVVKVKISDTQILYEGKEDGESKIYKTGIVKDPELVQRLQDQKVQFAAEIPEAPNIFLSIIVSYVLPILIFFGLGSLLNKRMMNRMGASGLNIYGKSGAKLYKPEKDEKNFDDVAGQEEAKESLQEIIDYLNQPDKYQKVGAKCPAGVLLVGPPGTGKTLIAKAVAGEAHVPFYSISGSEFIEMFVGRGAAKVRDLFEEANKHAPCIVFIDEIDTIGKSRENQMSTNDEREQTLNQLLTEMDGFGANKGVIILAATNRPDDLDPALLRPGRFDRQVRMELPDLEGREAILKVHLRKVQTDGQIDHNLIARMTSGASGAEVANIVNEAALRAVRHGREKVSTEDLVESIETVIAGAQKKNSIMSDEEKKIVSYHEIGHALIAALQKGSAPVTKITIIPRTSGALGYTMQVEESEKVLMSRKDILNQIETLVGGRAAEEVVFGEITTGASNDIEKATQLARQMVTRFGMSDKFGMMQLETGGHQYLGGQGQMNCSPETSYQIDLETHKIIDSCYAQAKQMISDNREKLDHLAAHLYQTETITGEEFMEIMNQAAV